MDHNRIRKDLSELQDLLKNFVTSLDDINAIGEVIYKALSTGGKLFACGNGGSATDAMHLCEELVGRYKDNRKALPAICLNADVGALTCIGNDFGYESIFSRQLEALGSSGDILVGFSTSGNSKNIHKVFELAKDLNIKTILVGGKDGGSCAKIANYQIIVPSKSTARIQEVHTFILHAWLEIIEAEIC